MGQARGEVSTNTMDLSAVSLSDLRDSDDPALLRSLRLVVGRTECGRTGVLQNQAPDAR
jgi:FXSXX-COOH protein